MTGIEMHVEDRWGEEVQEKWGMHKAQSTELTLQQCKTGIPTGTHIIY